LTQPRPTQEGLATAAGHLEELAYSGNELFYDVAMLMDLLVWLDAEISAAREAAAYGAGIAEVHVLGSSNRGLEGRLYDPLLKELRGMRRSWRSQVGGLVVDLQQDAAHAANWPHRTQETG
jgi:hypothetical protein